MYSNLTKHRKNIAVLALLIAIVMVSLSGRLGYLMLFCSEHYSAMAEDLHQRERTIKAARGRIIDANGVVIAGEKTGGEAQFQGNHQDQCGQRAGGPDTFLPAGRGQGG